MRSTALLRASAGSTPEARCACISTASKAVFTPASVRGVSSRVYVHRRCRLRELSCCTWNEGSHSIALQCSRAHVRSRSLPPDDPFGERGSWEDPSDGIYAAWKDVDQEGFVNAAGSQEVRQAHFGPEWARFTTVGRMSVKKMREDLGPQQAPPLDSVSVASQGSEEARPVAGSYSRRYPTAEEIHEADLRQRRQLLNRNYTSYEDFVEHELGGGSGFSCTKVDATPGPEAGMHQGDVKEDLHFAASMESEFFAVDGLDGCDRMAQRNVERAALETLEAAEVEEALPLPSFIFDSGVGNAAATATVSSPKSTPNMCLPGSVSKINRPDVAAGVCGATPFSAKVSPSGRVSHGASAGTDSIPAAVVRQVLSALGHPHGDSRLPLTDPIHWGTDDIILFLALMEQSSSSVEADICSLPTVCPTMDDTMCDTFRMARVTGEMLLNVVVPPRLFRLMRQWHLRRQDVVNTAWRLQGKALTPPVTTAYDCIEDAIVQAAVSQSRQRLSETVQQLDANLIQETILLCFPYAR